MEDYVIHFVTTSQDPDEVPGLIDQDCLISYELEMAMCGFYIGKAPVRLKCKVLNTEENRLSPLRTSLLTLRN